MSPPQVGRRWIGSAAPIAAAPQRRSLGLTPADIDNAFGNMRRAGLSHSRMNNARAVLSGAYKWGRRHDKANANPMRGFELPKSIKAPRRTTAPEIDELLTLLPEAARTDPDFSPVLTLAATTGMRRGELSTLRRKPPQPRPQPATGRTIDQRDQRRHRSQADQKPQHPNRSPRPGHRGLPPRPPRRHGPTSTPTRCHRRPRPVCAP